MNASRTLIVVPAQRAVNTGNRVTALRWQRVLETLAIDAVIAENYEGQSCDLLVALHARRSAESIERFCVARPDAPIVLALTGTDLYGDLHADPTVTRSMERASRIVVLHPLAVESVPEQWRSRVRTILQSVTPVAGAEAPRDDRFEVCVLANLRPVKDPFRAAAAAGLLPAGSAVHVLHAGAALEPGLAGEALREASRNPRYEWLGELERSAALRTLARSRLLVLASTMEGGANVVGEALVHDVPVLASRIPGSVGLLGEGYPGFFPVGETRALADLLHRAETEPAFLGTLERRCRDLAPCFAPEHEIAAWRQLLEEL